MIGRSGVFGGFDLAALVQPHLRFLFVCLFDSWPSAAQLRRGICLTGYSVAWWFTLRASDSLYIHFARGSGILSRVHIDVQLSD